MTTPETTPPAAVPPGYWQDASGNLVPESKVKDIDKVRTQLVTELAKKAEEQSLRLRQFKMDVMAEVAAFVAISLEQYGVKQGGEKGNVTLLSFDGRYKLVRQIQDRISFGEQLMAAKALIDECVQDWSAGANDNIRALVTHAFQTDKEGKINTGRVLGLRRLKIHDAKWQSAMDAIADSMQTVGSTPYVRFYKRNDATGQYMPISLDVASV